MGVVAEAYNRKSTQKSNADRSIHLWSYGSDYVNTGRRLITVTSKVGEPETQSRG